MARNSFSTGYFMDFAFFPEADFPTGMRGRDSILGLPRTPVLTRDGGYFPNCLRVLITVHEGIRVDVGTCYRKERTYFYR